jgi:hypothetical protein
MATTGLRIAEVVAEIKIEAATRREATGITPPGHPITLQPE